MTLAILPLPMYQLFCPNVSEVFSWKSWTSRQMVGDFLFWRSNKKVHFLANKRSKGKSTFCGCTSHSEDVNCNLPWKRVFFWLRISQKWHRTKVYVDESGGGSERYGQMGSSDLSCRIAFTWTRFFVSHNCIFCFFFENSCLYSYFTCVLWKR